MRGKKVVWAHYGHNADHNSQYLKYLNQSSVREYTSSLLGQMPVLDGKQYRIVAVQVIEEANVSASGSVIVGLREVPDVIAMKTWGGLDLTLTWDCRKDPDTIVQLSQKGVTITFEAMNEEDAEIIYNALARAMEFSITVDELVELEDKA